MRPEGSDPLRTGTLRHVPALLRSRLGVPAGFALVDGDEIRAHTLLKESLTLFSALMPTPGIAKTLQYLGALAVERRDSNGAKTVFKQGLELSQRQGDEWQRTELIYELGVLAEMAGEYECEGVPWTSTTGLPSLSPSR
jgi:hypothetical protein